MPHRTKPGLSDLSQNRSSEETSPSQTLLWRVCHWAAAGWTGSILPGLCGEHAESSQNLPGPTSTLGLDRWTGSTGTVSQRGSAGRPEDKIQPGQQWSECETLGAAQYNHSLLLVETGSCPVQPQSFTSGHWELPSTTTVFYWWTLGAAQYNHSLLLVDTGSCPVQPQSSTGGHWELPSTTTVFYWWTLGAAQYNHSLLVVDTGSCPVQPQSSSTLGAAQYNHSLVILVYTGSCLNKERTSEGTYTAQ